MHKPPPKVHWHAYWMLSIGAAFLIFTIIDYVAFRRRDSYDVIPNGGALGGGLGHNGGNSFAICAIVGVLFTGIGIYALRKA